MTHPAAPGTSNEPLQAAPVVPTTRRTFLGWTTGLAATVSAALIGFPTLRALFSPVFKRAAPLKWTLLGDAAAFELNVPVKIDFADTVEDAWNVTRVTRSVWIYTADGERFVAYNPRCTHLGCGYDYAPTTNTFHCPCHEGQFDVQTGARLAGPPPRPLDRLQLKTENGQVFVAYQNFRLGVAEAVPT